MARILVAEDDPSTLKLMCAVLKRAGFDVVAARDGLEALEALDKYHVDLLLTDVMMPSLDGFGLVEQLRDARIETPVLMVTAKGEVRDRRQGFLVGTDDYLVKPVDAQEMILRIKALLRRAKIVADHCITIGEVTLTYDNLTVQRGAQVETLPPKEFYLLYKLMAYPDTVFTRSQLLEEIWGMESDSDGSTVNVHINRLRNRFKDWPELEIQTIRGIGYRGVHHA